MDKKKETAKRTMQPKLMKCVRLSPTAVDLWEAAAVARGLNLTATMETAIRDFAKACGVPDPDKPKKPKD